MCQTVLVKEQLDAASAFLEAFSQQVPVVRTAQKAKQIRDLYDLKVPTRLNRDSLGETPVDGAYIYPPLPAHATSAS